MVEFIPLVMFALVCLVLMAGAAVGVPPSKMVVMAIRSRSGRERRRPLATQGAKPST